MSRLKRIFTDDRIALIIRWWSVGAVYFFIGWGTNLSQRGIIDFVFFLGLTIGVFNMLVINPVIRQLLNTKLVTRYTDIPIMKKVLFRLGEIFKSMVIVTIMVYIYSLINMVLIDGFKLTESSIPLAGEPISFGILYVVIWSLLNGFISNVKKRIKEIEGQ